MLLRGVSTVLYKANKFIGIIHLFALNYLGKNTFARGEKLVHNYMSRK
jgi:urea transporter